MAKILRNGRFFRSTNVGENNGKGAEFAECLVVDEDTGNILHVGSYQDVFVQDMAASGTEVLDMQGRVVIPGLIDSHMHLLMSGEALSMLDLWNCDNLPEIRTAIRDYAKAHPDLPRIIARMWRHETTNNQALASMIDDLDPRPVYIFAYDYHSAWCNSAALSEMNIAEMEDPISGTICRDEMGRPSGLLQEAASLPIIMPFLSSHNSDEQRVTSISNAFNAYISNGYTGLIDLGMWEYMWVPLLKYREQQGGRLPCWMAIHWIILEKSTPEETMQQVERAVELHKQFNMTNSPDFRITGIKVVLDGTVDGCTAFLKDAYTHNGKTSEGFWTPDKLLPVLKRADEAGLQIAMHAIGSGAIKMALDCLEEIGNPQGRHRIEHLETCDPEDVPRLGELGVIASVQPVHSDPATLGNFKKHLGPTRCQHIFPTADFAKHGATLAFGTDTPTAPILPLPNLYTASTRKSRLDPKREDRTTPQYAVSLAAAVTAATEGGAFSCFADKRVGRFEVGKVADLTVIDMVWDAEKLLEGMIMETWSRSRKVHG